MARIPLAARVGILAGLVWLASGALFAGIVWLSLLDSDAIRLVVPATIPVDLWHATPALTVLIVAGSVVAMAASVTFAAGRVLAATRWAPRSIVFVAMWFAVIVVGACIGALDGAARVIGEWPPPRLAFLVQGLPDAIAPTLYAGLVLGWIPALVLALSRRPETVPPSRGLASILIAATAGLVLLVASSVAIGTARTGGLAGEPPPAVQQPQPTPGPTGPPPPTKVQATGPIDPAWCTAPQLSITDDGGDAATGHREDQLRATNTSPTSCVLDGYPDIAFADARGAEVAAEVIHGGSFMTTDPGPAAVTLAPGASAIARLGWDATDGRTAIGAMWIAAYPGVERTVLPASLDIMGGTRVAVTAWQEAIAPPGE